VADGLCPSTLIQCFGDIKHLSGVDIIYPRMDGVEFPEQYT
jgi:hypothetical protein